MKKIIFISLLLFTSSLFFIKVYDDAAEKNPSKGGSNPASGMDLSASLDLALLYFRNVPEYEVATLLMLETYRRVFQLDGFDDLRQIYEASVKNASPALKNKLEVNWRIIDGERSVDKNMLSGLDGVDGITMPALYCDIVELPNGFNEFWEKELNKGGYEATHVALAYIWAVENQCSDLVKLPEKFPGLLEVALVEIIEAKDGLNDLEIEALCFLTMLGNYSSIKKNWIKLLLSQQNIDGGWPAYPSETKSEQHTSALAICTLLNLHYFQKRRGQWLPERS